jgi:hypothetical protein
VRRLPGVLFYGISRDVERAAHLLTCDEAGRIAANIAKLPGLLRSRGAPETTTASSGPARGILGRVADRQSASAPLPRRTGWRAPAASSLIYPGSIPSSPSYSAGLEFKLTGVAQSVELA